MLKIFREEVGKKISLAELGTDAIELNKFDEAISEYKADALAKSKKEEDVYLAKLLLEYLRKGSESRERIMNDLKREVEAGGFTLADIGTSGEELAKLLKK